MYSQDENEFLGREQPIDCEEQVELQKVVETVKIEQKVENITNEIPIFIQMNQKNIKKYQEVIKPVRSDLILIFDIDATLYEKNHQYESHFKMQLIESAFSKTTGFTKNEFLEYLKQSNRGTDTEMWRTHSELKIDSSFFDEAIAKIKFDEFFTADHSLRDKLNSIPHRKICFTNNSAFASKSTLEALGISSCFEAVVAVDTTGFVEDHYKPNAIAFDFIEDVFQIDKENKNVVFFDDKLCNVEAGIEKGWKGVHVDTFEVLQKELDRYN